MRFSIRGAIGACLSLGICVVAVASQAEIVKGVYVFDDTGFVDEVIGVGGTVQAFPIGPSLETSITDTSLATGALIKPGAFIDLGFADNVAVNGPGADLVVFETSFATAYDVTIAGVTLTVAGGFPFWEDENNSNAAEIELTDFLVPDGAEVTELRIARAASPGTPVITGVAALNIGSPVLEVDVDIWPGSEQNFVDPNSPGAVLVAILGSASFDVADVDGTTLAFGPAGAAPLFGPGGLPLDVNLDGFIDLLSLYSIPETGIQLGDMEACVTGETLSAEAFEGCDPITTTPPCGIGPELVFLLPPLLWLHGRRRRASSAHH